MCVGTVVSMAGQIGSTISGMLGASSAEKANRKAFREAERLAHEQATQAYFDLSLREATEAEAAASQTQEVIREAEAARAVAAVRAAEGGVSGRSVEALMQEFEMDEGRTIHQIQRNAHLSRVSLENQKRSVETRTEAAVLAARPQAVRQPDFLSAAFNVASTAIDGFGIGSSDPTTAPVNVPGGGFTLSTGEPASPASPFHNPFLN